MIVAVCADGKGGGCGGLVLDTQSRVSAHGPLDYAAYIGGGEFDTLVKQSGYKPNDAYGTGGTWTAPLLLHTRCAVEAGHDVDPDVLAHLGL